MFEAEIFCVAGNLVSSLLSKERRQRQMNLKLMSTDKSNVTFNSTYLIQGYQNFWHPSFIFKILNVIIIDNVSYNSILPFNDDTIEGLLVTRFCNFLYFQMGFNYFFKNNYIINI